MTELKTKTVSQCITADYCRGWNDAVEEANKVLDRIVEQLESKLKGTIERANGYERTESNKLYWRCEGKIIGFEEAIEIVKAGGVKNE